MLTSRASAPSAAKVTATGGTDSAAQATAAPTQLLASAIETSTMPKLTAATTIAPSATAPRTRRECTMLIPPGSQAESTGRVPSAYGRDPVARDAQVGGQTS